MNPSVNGKTESNVRPNRLGFPEWMAMVACVCLLSCLGCGYPPVGPKAYEITKALYSVCNLKRQDDLDKVTDVISQAVSRSELSKSESEWLMSIVEQAKSGEWSAAAEEARSILKDQVNQ